MKNRFLAICTLTLISLSSLVACGGSSNSSGQTSSNNATNNASNAPLIFGHAYGMCKGEHCIETFKLTESKLFEDKKDDYSHQTFDFEQLNSSKHNQVKDLLNQVPNALLTHETGRIGCPDCADGGGIYISVVDNGQNKSWFIDNNLNNVPTELHAFVKQVRKKIKILQASD